MLKTKKPIFRKLPVLWSDIILEVKNEISDPFLVGRYVLNQIRDQKISWWTPLKSIKEQFCKFFLFSSHTSLRRHEQKHQGINYKCARCSRSFNDPSNLRRHEQSCNGEAGLSEDEIVPETTKIEKKEEVKPHRCGYCSKVTLSDIIL